MTSTTFSASTLTTPCSTASYPIPSAHPSPVVIPSVIRCTPENSMGTATYAHTHTTPNTPPFYPPQYQAAARCSIPLDYSLPKCPENNVEEQKPPCDEESMDVNDSEISPSPIDLSNHSLQDKTSQEYPAANNQPIETQQQPQQPQQPIIQIIFINQADATQLGNIMQIKNCGSPVKPLQQLSNLSNIGASCGGTCKIAPAPSADVVVGEDNQSPAPPRQRSYAGTHTGCTKTYLKGSHLKAHIRTHTGVYLMLCLLLFFSVGTGDQTLCRRDYVIIRLISCHHLNIARPETTLPKWLPINWYID